MHDRLRLTLVSLILAAALLPHGAEASILGSGGLPAIEVSASADATVSAVRPLARLGRASGLSLERGRSYGLVRFASNPPGTISKATLRVYLVRGRASRLLVSATGPRPWRESRVTYRTAPRPVGSSVGSGQPQGRWVDVDVTEFVKVQGGAALALRSSRGRIVLRSREAKGRAPRLLISRQPAESSPIVMAAGDISCDPGYGKYNGGAGTATECAQARTSDLFAASLPDAVLALGDTQYEDGRLAAFRTAWGPTWGRAGARLHPTVGNHEYATEGAAGYFDYFDGTGKTSGAAGRRGEGWYSFDLGSWHLIALNSNCFRISCKKGSAQESFLRQDLAAHRGVCTLAFWHHPLFTSGQQGKFTDQRLATTPLYEDLYAAGADVLLTGHDHDYERFAPLNANGQVDPKGIREWVVGTGGESHLPFVSSQPGSEVRNSDTFGVLRLTLRTDGYDWRFLPVTGSAFTDSGTAQCH
jgi:hypothetical protein